MDANETPADATPQPAFAGRWLLRKLNPIPRSPEPATAAERFTLRLVPEEALTEKFAIAIQTLRAEGRCIGPYLEFGVYNGTSLACMFRAQERMAVDAPLIGFDSFEGLPPEVVNEDHGVWRAGQFSCPIEVTVDNLEAKGVDADRVTLVKGWYRDTLAKPPADYGIARASIIMIDCDCYSSARRALTFAESALDDVCVIFFDDWKLNDLDLRGQGEYRAFKEFLRSGRWSVTDLGAYSRKSKIFLVRRRMALISLVPDPSMPRIVKR